MKNLLPFLLFPLFSVAQNISDTTAKGDFSITGNIKGLPDSTMVFIARPGQPSDVLATAYARKGKFELFGKIVNGDIYQLNFIGFPDQPEVFLTSSKLNVTGDIKTLKKLSFIPVRPLSLIIRIILQNLML
ncbi:MAG: DUF4369 domain-containing protein [Segetibacter sp.]